MDLIFWLRMGTVGFSGGLCFRVLVSCKERIINTIFCCKCQESVPFLVLTNDFGV